jgi:hypothetical protein
MIRVRVVTFVRAAGLAGFCVLALVNLRLPFLGPGKPIKGFGYALSPGEFAEYRVGIQVGDQMSSHAYRVVLLSERAERRERILTFEHSESFASEPRSVVQFEVARRNWAFFVGAPAKHPVAPLKITLQKGAEPVTVVDSQPGLSILGRKLGFGFHFLENFSAAVKDVKPGNPQEVSFGAPSRKVSAVAYDLNYKTEDFYEGEIPRRVEATISGRMLASDEVPFGIVRAEFTKAVKRAFEVKGVKSRPESVRLQITLSLEKMGINGTSHLVAPVTEQSDAVRPRSGPPRDAPAGNK